MAIYHIDAVYPTSGAAPTNEYDVVTGIHYTSWETDDEVRFNYVVPSYYDNDNELILRIDDSTPETSNKHRWQATVYLLRPNVDDPTSPTIWSIRASDYDPPSTADQLETRELTLTSSGQVGGDGGAATDVEPGYTLSIILKRIAPVVGSDDTNEIKVLGMALTFTYEEDLSSCSGRAGAIITEVMQMFQDNDTDDQWLTDTMVVRWINQCYRRIAGQGVFRKTGALTLTASTSSYTILSTFDDCIRVANVVWTDSSLPLTQLHSRAQWDRLIEVAETGTPQYWLVDGPNLLIGPAPDTVTDTLTVTYEYMPDEMDCVTYINPITPPAYDEVYVSYCLYRAFMREERDGVRSNRLSADYHEIYKDQMYDLIGNYTPYGVSGVPG